MDTAKDGTPQKAAPKSSLGIYGRLILLLLAALVPILLIESLIYFERFQTRRAEELQSNVVMAKAVGRAFDAFVKDILGDELAIGLAATASPPLSESDLKRLLEADVEYNFAVRSLNWVGPDGRLLVSSDPKAAALDISDRPYFQQVASGRDWVVSDLVRSRVDGQPVFSICRAIRDERGALLGIVTAAILPDRLGSVLAIERSDEGGISLVDRKGMLVFRFPHIQLSWDERRWAERSEIFKQALEGREAAQLVSKSTVDGKGHLIAAAPIRSIGWAASAERREEDAMRVVTSDLIRHGGMTIAAAAFSVLAALFISRTVAAPIRRMQRELTSFHNSRFEARFDISGPAEIQELAAAFNATLDTLQESEDQFRSVVESAPDAIFIQTQGCFAYLNRAAIALFGASSERELLGLPVVEQFHPDYRELVSERIRQLNEKAASVRLVEERIICLDGSPRDVEVSAVPFTYTGKSGALVFAQDISDRKQAEEEIRELTRRLSYHVQNSPLAVIEWGPDMRICRWSGEAERMFGWSADEVLGKRMEDFRWIYEEDEAEVAEVSSELKHGTDPKRFSYNRNYRKDGSIIHCEWYNSSLLDGSGELQSILSLVLDVTMRKVLEEQLRRSRDELEIRIQERTAELQASNKALMEHAGKLERLNAELQDFAFVAAHDLQEPLRKIQTFCDMTLKRCAPALNATGREYLERVVRSATRMRELLHDLLQFSIVASRPEPFKETDIGRIVREVANRFTEDLRDSGGLVDVENIPAIEADEAQMLRLFENLIENSIKYRGDRSLRVRVYAKQSEGRCEIMVEDNGIGFDQRYAERIFRPLQRLHDQKIYEGTGMGLAICRKIVEWHGGSIRAESQPGKGSTFVISLPVQQGVPGSNPGVRMKQSHSLPSRLSSGPPG